MNNTMNIWLNYFVDSELDIDAKTAPIYDTRIKFSKAEIFNHLFKRSNTDQKKNSESLSGAVDSENRNA